MKNTVNPKTNKILIFGAGYVGFSIGVFLGQKYEVIMVDVDTKKILAINNSQSPIDDELIDHYLKHNKINIRATDKFEKLIEDVDLCILALPTNFKNETNQFDVKILTDVIHQINSVTDSVPIVIKSTVPVGFTRSQREKFSTQNIYFSPEFLREGNSLEDCINPSRIIIGGEGNFAVNIAEMFYSLSENKPDVFYLNNDEAEAVKLFSNTYLAMRIAFFNEVDSFALKHSMSARNLIKSICKDNRIGNIYNNPSFGYGGYCLPKDTKQLLTNFNEVPQSIIEATISSNQKRKDFLSEYILKLQNIKKIGVYRLSMKEGSKNFRESSILNIVEKISQHKEILIYEPLIRDSNFKGIKISDDLESFKSFSDLIIANRHNEELADVSDKVFTRDLFNVD